MPTLKELATSAAAELRQSNVDRVNVRELASYLNVLNQRALSHTSVFDQDFWEAAASALNKEPCLVRCEVMPRLMTLCGFLAALGHTPEEYDIAPGLLSVALPFCDSLAGTSAP